MQRFLSLFGSSDVKSVVQDTGYKMCDSSHLFFVRDTKVVLKFASTAAASLLLFDFTELIR
jgi:hypothetical protein